MNCNEQEISIYRPFSLVQNVVEEIESKFQSHYSKGFDGDYSSKCNFSLQSDSFQEREFSSISSSVWCSTVKGAWILFSKSVKRPFCKLNRKYLSPTAKKEFICETYEKVEQEKESN